MIFTKYIILLLIIVELIAANISTTYTNYVSLEEKVPFVIALCMSTVITICFNFLMAFKFKTWKTRTSAAVVMFFSSFLAINSFTKEEIADAEFRLSSDSELQQMVDEKNRLYNQLDQLYGEYAAVEKTITTQTDSGWKWGAYKARQRAEIILLNITTKESILKNVSQNYVTRETVLKNNGSQINEANIRTVMDFISWLPIPLSEKMISSSSNIIYSLINDFAIGFGLYILQITFNFGIAPTLFQQKRRTGDGLKNDGTKVTAMTERDGTNFFVTDKRRRRKPIKEILAERRRIARMAIKLRESTSLTVNEIRLRIAKDLGLTRVPSRTDVSDIINGRYPYLTE
jgi:hypothetical protein